MSSGGVEASLELYRDGRLRWSWEGSSLVTQSQGCCDASGCASWYCSSVASESPSCQSTSSFGPRETLEMDRTRIVRSAIADAQPSVRAPRHSLRGARMCMALYMITTNHSIARAVAGKGSIEMAGGSVAARPALPLSLPAAGHQSGISRLAAATTRSARFLPEPRRTARPRALGSNTRAACRDVCASDPRRRAREGLRCRARSRAEERGPLRSR